MSQVMTGNVQRVRAYIEAAYSGDMEGAASFLAPDVVLAMGGSNPLAGVHQGREAFFAAFGRMMELSRGTYRLEQEVEWFESPERAVLLAVESAEVAGDRVSFPRVITYTFRDGLIVEVRVYEGDPSAADRAFAGV